VTRFVPKNYGSVNRRFSEVRPGPARHCYEAENGGGRMIVRLLSDKGLKIEYQSGACDGNLSLMNPTTYHR